MSKQIISLLSLCQKAGKIVSGESMCEQALKNGSAKIVIIADDASNGTKKNFQDACTYRQVPIYFFATKEVLGNAIGKELRASLAVTDSNFKIKIEKLLHELV
jgi:ribosomal protein L7Ae-like RNA K-turn-binding protein